MAVKNYTTSIKADKTIIEIEKILIKFGAKGIYKEYEGERLSGIMFYLQHNEEKIPFKIPTSIEKTRSAITKAVKEHKLPKKYLNEPLRTEQGERVVMRIIKDWIESQLSLMEIGFADSIEVLLPYAYNVIEDKTMYEKFLENKKDFLALEHKD